MKEQQEMQQNNSSEFDFISLTAHLPSLTSKEEIDRLRNEGYITKELIFLRNFQPQRDMLRVVNQALRNEAAPIFYRSNREMKTDIILACEESSYLILDLLLNPPKKIDICSRNPKQEYSRMARMFFQSKIFQKPVRFVVPVCPDSYQYKLRDGIGDVGVKALLSIEKVSDFFHDHGFKTHFDIHVADVEGLDSAILEISGETTETHFFKTTETRRKIQDEARQRDMKNVDVYSMNQEFITSGLSYLENQEIYTDIILKSDKRNVIRSIDQLIAERNRLHNFDGMTEEMQKKMASRELAGYAAYGDMIQGRAIILSPDAMSAIPAYHFGNFEKHQFTPVYYAK